LIKKEWLWMEKLNKMKCPTCESNLIWEFVGHENEPMVSNYSCPTEDCDVEKILVYYKEFDDVE
tara:strand:- start:1438 stop:1629 length:192 start_codon:yes stop_codon:yes gene_type:complete